MCFLYKSQKGTNTYLRKVFTYLNICMIVDELRDAHILINRMRLHFIIYAKQLKIRLTTTYE